MASIKLKMGYCKDCGNTEPKPIIKDQCTFHYWNGKRKPIERRPTKIESMVAAVHEMDIAVLKKRKAANEKSVSELLKLAEIVFNRWIKDRDKEDNDWFTCISCGQFRVITIGQAGHYRPKGVSSLRFNDFNLNLECEPCNCHDPDHLIGYRENLIKKIGLEEVERLEAVPFSEEHKWEKQELLDIIEMYR